MLRLFYLFIALAAVTTGALARERFAFTHTPGDLPKTVIPLHYDLRLTPDIATRTFSGLATVDIDVREPVARIELKADELDIAQASLGSQTLAVSYDRPNQGVSLTSPSPIAKGKHRLSMRFSGKIIERSEGLFLARYRAPSGEKEMLATQMEPISARRVFPGWDEPAFRASFRLTLVIPGNLTAVSNTPIAGEKALADGRKEISFAPTPRMSTYLLAFAVGEFETIEDEAEGVMLRIVTAEGKREQGRYALAATKEILRFYNRYFGVRYPLPKLDQVAVPGAFTGFGAMENWGAIFYDEAILLDDPATSTPEDKMRTFGTIAHEIAHQWFGNLVTMAWWDDLWLNEGFATWMGYKAFDTLRPAWNRGALVTFKEDAMAEDARKSSHSIQHGIANDRQANDAFDAIAYKKGREFLRMLESYLGENVFRAGIRRYISAHRYSNATTADLWAALEAASGKSISRVAATWIEQPGFPVVIADARCESGKTRVRFAQERYVVNDPAAVARQWLIPLRLARGRDAQSLLLDGAVHEASFANCSGPVNANAGGNGYYRVQYDAAVNGQFIRAFGSLPERERVNLIADRWALVVAERLDSAGYLDFIEAARGDDSRAVTTQAIHSLQIIRRVERGQPGQSAFYAYSRGWLQPQLARLGWDARPGEDLSDSALRGQVIAALSEFDDGQVIAEARRRFAEFLDRPESLPATLRAPVLQTVGRHADEETFGQLKTLAEKSLSQIEKRAYYNALFLADSETLAKRALTLSADAAVPIPVALNAAHSVSDAGHPDLAWDYATAHWDDLSTRLSPLGRNAYLGIVAENFIDAARADELETFAQDRLGEIAMPIIRKYAEAIRAAALLKSRELGNIDHWIDVHKPRQVGSDISMAR